jgi:hypothetical protein
MATTSRGTVTQLLLDWGKGDAAVSELMKREGSERPCAGLIVSFP